MTNSPTLSVRIPAEVRAQLEEYCQANGLTLAQLLIKSACEKIGKPELFNQVKPPHRPKTEPEQ